MNNEKNITEKALRYIHGEMSEGEIREFEAVLRANPALQSSVAEDRLIFEKTKPLRGVPVGSWDRLAEHILAEMDRTAATPATGGGRVAEVIPFPAGRAESPRRSRRFPRMILAAAALLLLFMVPRWMIHPLGWQAPLIDQSAALREAGGQETAFQRYTEQDFQQAFARFQETMDRSYRRTRGFTLLPRREWQLSTSIREMRAGRVEVSVVAVHPDQAVLTREWTEYYRNLEAWGGEDDTLAQRIAGELRER